MSLPPNFNRLAGLYRWMEWFSFGPWLAWCRATYLPEASTCRQALILGDGDGRFTARLLAGNPTIEVDAVDASPAMLSALVRRAGCHANRVNIHHADARSWRPESENQQYDLIATHFFLDCLTSSEIECIATNLRPFLAPSATWIVSDFAVPQSHFGRLLARPIVSALYLAFAALTGLAVRALPDHAAAFHRSGFTLKDRRTRLAGLLVSELWSAGLLDQSETETNNFLPLLNC